MVILGVISFVTVLILAIMNSITAPVIAQRLADEKRESIASLFGDEIEYDIAPEYIVSAPVTEAIIVKNIWSKELDGYCVIVTPKGFNGKIVMLVAVNPDITVKDIKILEMSETAGQGTKIDSEKSFRDQFKYKTKDIRIGITGENTVNVIAGATVSSRAFVNGVNAALAAADEISRKMSGAEDELPTEEFEQPDDDTEPDGINDLDELNETAENEEESAGENPDE
jgi:electron transport complex protein RnfG